MKNLFVLTILLMSYTSCMKIQKKEDDVQTNTAQPVPVVTMSNPEEKISVLKPNDQFFITYDNSKSLDEVNFHIPDSWGNELLVEKSRTQGLNVTEKIFQREIRINQNQWTDSITEDQKFNYKFYLVKDSQQKLIKEIDVIPSQNLNLNSDYNLYQKYSLNEKVQLIYFRNLSIQSGVHLYVGDYKGQLIIEKIISENGIIQTFPDSLRAENSKNGRSVGGFQLVIQSGEGPLNIILNAENGGDGVPGKAPDAALKGADGQVGAFATFKSRTHVDIQPRGGFSLPMTYYSCDTSPGPGQNGQNGLMGYPGADAGDGGDVKAIQLTNHSNEIQLIKKFKVGKKGIGGRGGAGGQPGVGGLAGDGNEKALYKSHKIDPDNKIQVIQFNIFNGGIEKPCSPAANGIDGKQGEKGLDGHDGQDGQFIENSVLS